MEATPLQRKGRGGCGANVLLALGNSVPGDSSSMSKLCLYPLRDQQRLNCLFHTPSCACHKVLLVGGFEELLDIDVELVHQPMLVLDWSSGCLCSGSCALQDGIP